MERATKNSPIWVITSYFALDDPTGSQRRLATFHEFRKRLNAPLLAVEFTTEGLAFHLEEEDADHLIQIRGGDVLWQKERLLNLALDALPQACKYVAWVDCDVVIMKSNWPSAAQTALEKSNLIQLFQKMRFLDEGVSLEDTQAIQETQSFNSIAWAWSRGEIPEGALARPAITVKYGWTPGFAWAARRSVLESTHFYESLIMGGGDKAIFYAACGEAPALVKGSAMSSKQSKHYLEWAKSYYQAVDGKIGHLDNEAVHLWHGDIKFRGYDTRYFQFEKFDFDPENDIKVGSDGALYWSSDKPALHQRAIEFFEGRKRTQPLEP